MNKIIKKIEEYLIFNVCNAFNLWKIHSINSRINWDMKLKKLEYEIKLLPFYKLLKARGGLIGFSYRLANNYMIKIYYNGIVHYFVILIEGYEISEDLFSYISDDTSYPKHNLYKTYPIFISKEYLKDLKDLDTKITDILKRESYTTIERSRITEKIVEIHNNIIDPITQNDKHKIKQLKTEINDLINLYLNT